MRNLTLISAVATIAVMGAASASAQDMPMGAEIYNQNVQVSFADGTVNNVYFEEDGDAVIRAPGVNPVNAQWRVQGNQLCLYAGGGNECWNYTNRFVAGQPLTLVSSCDVSSQWTAAGVNQLAQPPLPPVQRVLPQPTVDRSGERG